MSSELLKGFRMLDLTDDKGAVCGRIFADFGAEVIKVEPPAGCPTRRIPPFLENQPGSDRSLYFLAYEASKLSVTTDLKSADGRALFKELVKKSDFLVESYPLGYLESLGLGYRELAEANPRLIYVSITPFGGDGPGRNYKAYDIITWAAGGMMYLLGQQGKPPLEMSLPQAGLHAGAEAAVGALLAHYPRESSGRGQRVVVDMQACIVWTLMNEQAVPILHGETIQRSGVSAGSQQIQRKMIFRCADGFVTAMLVGGDAGVASNQALVKWMDEKGFAAEWMKSMNWASWLPGMFLAAQEEDLRQNAEMEQRLEAFFQTMGRREIYAEGLKRRILLAPISTAADIAGDEQLRARDFFADVAHPALGRTLRMPGAFAKFSRTPLGSPTPAPSLGEHNRDVYCGLLGLSASRLDELRANGAI